MENNFTLQDRFAVENRIFDDVCEGTINPSEFLMVQFITRQCCLKNTDSVELSCGFLAKKLNLTKCYVIKIEKSLEEKGYITVTHNSKDKRNLPNTITINKGSIQKDTTIQNDGTIQNSSSIQNKPTILNEGSSSILNEGRGSIQNRTHNKTIEDNTEDNNIATSDSSYTDNDSVVKNETTAGTTDESKKIYEWVKKTLDKGKELLSNYRDTHTREEADESWSKITKLTSLMNKAIGKNKLTEKQSEMLQDFIAKASRANEGKEKYLSKVSDSNSVTSITTTGTTFTSSSPVECEFGLKYNSVEGKYSVSVHTVGEMLYKLHNLSGQEKIDYQLHVNEVMDAYGDASSRNAYDDISNTLANEGEEEFFKLIKTIGVDVKE